MQRSSTEVQLATSAGRFVVAIVSIVVAVGFALPGQAAAPMPMGRSWPTLIELVNALKRRMVLATFLGRPRWLGCGAGCLAGHACGQTPSQSTRPDEAVYADSGQIQPTGDNKNSNRSRLLKRR